MSPETSLKLRHVFSCIWRKFIRHVVLVLLLLSAFFIWWRWHVKHVSRWTVMHSMYYHYVASNDCDTQSEESHLEASRLMGNLRIRYFVEDNLASNDVFRGSIYLYYTGSQPYMGRAWKIFFTSTHLIAPYMLRDNPGVGIHLGKSGIAIRNVEGGLHYLCPSPLFQGFHPREKLFLPFDGEDYSVAKTDIFPNWYLFENITGTPEFGLIQNTAGEDLRFVGDFDTPKKWKQTEFDAYNPYTPETRFHINELNSPKTISVTPRLILPTPKFSALDPVLKLSITENWVVAHESEGRLEKEATDLADKLKVKVLNKIPDNNYILLSHNASLKNLDEYSVEIRQNPAKVVIHGNSDAAVFYGIQTLLGLLVNFKNDIPIGKVQDHPRLSYRGVHLDVARNFISKDGVLKILEVMSWYKLNKLHLHLSDDESWRLEVEGLPELTTIGARKCFDLTESICILPQLGSRINVEGQFFSKTDYQEILAYAQGRHIQVIPEIDMPGHSNAAIKAMEQRYRSLRHTDLRAAREFLLTEPGDPSRARSLQGFRRNVVNPCINSTYTFVRHVIRELVKLHKGIQPLTIFHLGGDEVAHSGFDYMAACQGSDSQTSREKLQEYFVKNVSKIAFEEGLDVAGWEDGLIQTDITPYERGDFPNRQVYAYSWQSLWEYRKKARAYVLANKGFKVILSHATHLYFDHPQEPDPLERGLYWATRFIDLHKAFMYNVNDAYDNIKYTRFGATVNRDEICSTQECPPLINKDNIIGLQAQLWTETVRNQSQVEEMLFPRLLAVAERAWHQASWETIPNLASNNLDQAEDWKAFILGVTQYQLPRLDQEAMSYYLSPPGARLKDGMVELNTQFEGLPIYYSINSVGDWQLYSKPIPFTGTDYIRLQTRSTDHKRSSRVITFPVEQL